MGSETTPAKDSPVVFQEATSKKGKKYQVSTDKKKTSLQKSAFAVDVNWPPSEDWVYLSQDLAKEIHITRYMLHENPPPSPLDDIVWYKWTLRFTNTDDYDFWFEDNTHDEYENDTWLNKDHETSYNSDDPTIISVRGT